jgi:hypothetical protein
MPSNRRIKNKTKDRFKKSFKKLVSGLNRRVTVYLHPNEAECPNCYYDKVNRTSSGVCKVSPGEPNYFVVGRCPVCLGKGVLVTTRRKCIDGIVIWNPGGNNMNSLTFTEAGFEGATKVEIKTDPCNLELIKNAKYVLIDGLKCKLSNPPIIRGLGAKDILIALFFTTDKPRKNSGERL